MKGIIQALNGCVRPVVALTLTLALVGLTWRGSVDPAEFVPIVTFVLGYWFRARDTEAIAIPPRG